MLVDTYEFSVKIRLSNFLIENLYIYIPLARFPVQPLPTLAQLMSRDTAKQSFPEMWLSVIVFILYLFFQPDRPSYGRSKSGLSRLSMLAKSTEDLAHAVNKKEKKDKDRDMDSHDLNDGKRSSSGILGFKSPFKKGKTFF